MRLDISNRQMVMVVLGALAIVGAYVVAALGCLVWNYRRSDLNQRRRIHLLTAGAIVGVGAFFAGFPLAIFAYQVWAHPAMQLLIPALTLPFPVCFAYAVLKHQLFDIRVMIRQGVQYAVARGVLLYLVPVCVAALVLDFALHRDLTVGALTAQRGWPYAALAGVAGIAHLQRRRWMESLDRRFFRERYDAERLLRELVEEIRQARALDAVAVRVMAQIEATLHTRLAALLVREPRQPQYSAVAASPAGGAPPGLDSDSKLLTIFRVLGKPMQLSSAESGWLKELPSSESSWLTRCGIELLVPVCLGSEGKEAILALGPKRSEEPYSRQDMDLLMAIANSLALLLERPAPLPAPGGFEECPQCGNCYDSGARRCQYEGTQLTPMPFLRVLAGRYRLERRLGAGGMGTVYRATDLALEREVAVKMLRRELIVNPEAAERFRRESRMSAAVSHPNLVAIHDFGFEAGRGAFLVMELLTGRTLRQELLQAQRLSPGRALEILRGVCTAVEAAHRRGLVHRDLKPENIFLARTETGETPKVLDFGVGKMLAPAAGSALPTADTGQGVLVGTAHYMCPEQLRGEAVDPVWDLWALGVIAYEMLAGAHPFAGTTVASLHAAVLSGRFKPLAEALPGAPAALDGFFHAALSSDRAQRPATADTFLSAFERSIRTAHPQSA